jgi:hypothetical protein
LALWREENPETFKATIVAAAERLSIQPLAVEKDYCARLLDSHH